MGAPGPTDLAGLLLATQTLGPGEYVMAVLLGGLFGFAGGLVLGTAAQVVSWLIGRGNLKGGPQWAGYGAVVGAAGVLLWRLLR